MLAAWIQVIKKRLSLWCQQCKQHSFSAVSALAPLQWCSGHCRPLRPRPAIHCGLQAQLHWRLSVVPLVDLSPGSQSARGVMLRWVWSFGHAPLHSFPSFVFNALLSFSGERRDSLNLYFSGFSFAFRPETCLQRDFYSVRQQKICCTVAIKLG